MNIHLNKEAKRLRALENKKKRYTEYYKYSPEEIEKELQLEIKLKISARSANCLRRQGINNIDRLVYFYKKEGKTGFDLMRNVGKVTIEEILRGMEKYGIDLDETERPEICPSCGGSYKRYEELFNIYGLMRNGEEYWEGMEKNNGE